MELFVAKNGQQLGPFSETQVRQMLADGSAAGTDLAWHSGMGEWQPLQTVLAPAAGPTAPPAATVLPAPLEGSGGYPLAPGSAYADGFPAVTTANLAEPLTRLWAALIDGLLFGLCSLPQILGALLDGGRSSNGQLGTIGAVGAGVSVLLYLGLAAYQMYLVSTTGQSLGKRFLGVRIVRMNGQPAGFVNGVLLRSIVGSALPGLIPCLGGVYVITDCCFIFRQDRRCIHDLIADTHVVKA